MDLGGVHAHGPQVLSRYPVERDILAEEPRKHAEDSLHSVIQVQNIRLMICLRAKARSCRTISDERRAA